MDWQQLRMPVNVRTSRYVILAKVIHSCYPLTIRLLVDSRDTQVAPKLMVILIMPSHSCTRHKARDKSTASTRQTLQDSRMLPSTSDIATKALPMFPPKPVVILVMPSHSCARTARDKSTTSTRQTPQNFRLLSTSSDIAPKALPATSSRTKNPTRPLFTDSIMVT